MYKVKLTTVYKGVTIEVSDSCDDPELCKSGSRVNQHCINNLGWLKEKVDQTIMQKPVQKVQLEDIKEDDGPSFNELLDELK